MTKRELLNEIRSGLHMRYLIIGTYVGTDDAETEIIAEWEDYTEAYKCCLRWYDINDAFGEYIKFFIYDVKEARFV